jgi:purine-cytosine permease-like protein
MSHQQVEVGIALLFAAWFAVSVFKGATVWPTPPRYLVRRSENASAFWWCVAIIGACCLYLTIAGVTGWYDALRPRWVLGK